MAGSLLGGLSALPLQCLGLALRLGDWALCPCGIASSKGWQCGAIGRLTACRTAAMADAMNAEIIHQGTWIRFVAEGVTRTGKTECWTVMSRDGLGHVRWFGRWRKYAFFPAEGAVFEEVCLREIANFCQARTKEHRANGRTVKRSRRDEHAMSVGDGLA